MTEAKYLADTDVVAITIPAFIVERKHVDAAARVYTIRREESIAEEYPPLDQRKFTHIISTIAIPTSEDIAD